MSTALQAAKDIEKSMACCILTPCIVVAGCIVRLLAKFLGKYGSYCSRSQNGALTRECEISTGPDPRDMILGSLKTVYRPTLYKIIFIFLHDRGRIFQKISFIFSA